MEAFERCVTSFLILNFSSFSLWMSQTWRNTRMPPRMDKLCFFILERNFVFRYLIIDAKLQFTLDFNPKYFQQSHCNTRRLLLLYPCTLLRLTLSRIIYAIFRDVYRDKRILLNIVVIFPFTCEVKTVKRSLRREQESKWLLVFSLYRTSDLCSWNLFFSSSILYTQ